MEKTLRFLLYATLFTPLIVAYGMAFPFITSKVLAFQALTFVAALIWLYLWYTKPERFAPKATWLTVAIGGYIFVSFIAALQGVNFGASFWSNFERMDGVFTWISLLVFFIVLGAVFKTKEDWIWLFRVSLLVSIIAAFQSVRFFGLFEDSFLLPTRMPGIFGNPIYVGVYAMFHIFIALILFSFLTPRLKAFKDIFSLFKNSWTIFYGIGLLVNLFLLALALARGPLIGFLAGMGVFFIWYAIYSNKRRLFLRFIGIFFLALLIAFPLWNDSSLAQRIYSVSAGLRADETRTINWDTALQAFKARPLLGWGSNNYLIAQQEFFNPHLLDFIRQRFDRPHNKYLEVAVDGGILGLASYASIFGVLFYTLFRKRKEEPFLTALLAGTITAHLVQNIPAFDHPASYLFLFLILAFSNSEFARPFKLPQRPSPLLVVGGWALIALFLWQGAWQPFLQSRILLDTLAIQAAFSERQVEILNGYERSLSFKSIGNREARIQLGTFVLAQPKLLENLLDFSIVEVEKEYNSSPRDDTIGLILAKLYELKGRVQQNPSYHEKAREVFEDIIASFPNYFLLRQHYAVFLIEQGELEEAREHVGAIREFNEELFYKEKELQWQLMLTYYLADEDAKAYEVLHEASSRGMVYFIQDDPSKFPLMAEVFGAVGKTEEMITWYEEYYEKALRHVIAAFDLAYIYKYAGEKEKARVLIQSVIEKEKDPSLKERGEEFLRSLDQD